MDDTVRFTPPTVKNCVAATPLTMHILSRPALVESSPTIIDLNKQYSSKNQSIFKGVSLIMQICTTQDQGGFL